MRAVSTTALATAVVLSQTAGTAVHPAHGADAFTEALTGGKAHMNARLRHEEVSVDSNTVKDATALTLRTRMGYTTETLNGFSGMLEFEDTREVAETDQYAPVDPNYATIADPPVTEVNQAYVDYAHESGFSARYGRQRIILENARFVGNVGWRQDEQTYDAFRADYENEDVQATLGWLMAVNSIITPLDRNTSNGIAHLTWKSVPGGSLTGYGYLLENDTTERELDTYGGRYDGSTELDSLALLYTLEFATQERIQPGTNDFEADYHMLSAGVRFQGVTFKANHELLGSDDGNYGFQTPLATKHAFNGWADQFLSTPNSGLEDQFFSVSGSVAGVSLKAVHHTYSADEGNAEYGTETDLVASRSFGDHYQLGVKYASYSAEDFSSDTDKFWLWGTFKF